MRNTKLATPQKSNGGRREAKDPLARLRKAKKNVPAYTEAERNAPLQRCLDCASWKSSGEIERHDYLDISSGRCHHSGTQTPPMHTCPAWCNDRGDTKEKPADRPYWDEY